MRDISRRIEKVEKTVGITEGTDPRASYYPNTVAESALMACEDEEKWQQFLRTRKSKPCPKFWDWLDQQIEQLKATKNQKIRYNLWPRV